MANDKNARAEVIAALVTDKYSGFKTGDEAILEACSDTRLEEFRSASEQRKLDSGAYVKLEAEHRNVAARLKIAEERIKTHEQEMTEEEFIQRAPARIKTLIEAYQAEEDATRASIIARLKDLGANTEDELKKMKTDELKTLAAYARVPVPDFSGRGMPVERHAAGGRDRQVDYTPPNPYDEGLKALRAAVKH